MSDFLTAADVAPASRTFDQFLEEIKELADHYDKVDGTNRFRPTAWFNQEGRFLEAQWSDDDYFVDRTADRALWAPDTGRPDGVFIELKRSFKNPQIIVGCYIHGVQT